ncbi:MAG: MFS transporter [Dehalococcoidia bacterium]
MNASTLPIFGAFFTWGFGTGAQNLGRPLFAYAATGNVFLVGVMLAASALPRMFTGPITGYLTDRLGRKPLAILGAFVRGLTNLGQFFADDYATFLALEVAGQIGVAMWGTSSAVLLADVTSTSNRGHVLALRHMSMRLGFVAGPVLGGALALAFDLQAVFLLNALSKFLIVLLVLFLVSETRPEAAPAASPRAAAQRPQRRFSLQPFRDRSFVALAAATIAFACMQAGVVQALVPVHAQEVLGANEAQVGLLLTLSPVFAFIFAFPNGLLSDKLGRKASLVPGLLLLATAAFVLNLGSIYPLLIAAMMVQGTGEALTLGTVQTYAMDLAPAHGRGAFIGMWNMTQSTGATLGPLLLAGLYEFAGPAAAFLCVAGLLLLAATLIATLARETAGRNAVPST